MSFMAGFGQTFSETFQRGIDDHRKQEADTFKLTFDRFLKNDGERKKAREADTANARKAASLAETVAPGVNKKAATAKIYEMLTNGLDESYIVDVFNQPGTQVDFETEIRQNKDSLEAQTEAVMAPGSSATKAENMNQVQPQGKGSFRDNFLGGLFGSPYSKRQNSTDRAAERVAKETGVPLSEVQGTLSGGSYEPGKLIDTAGIRFTPGISTKKDDFTTHNAAMIELKNAEHLFQTNPSPAAQERLDTAKRRVEAIQEAKVFEAQVENGSSRFSLKLVRTPDNKFVTKQVGMDDAGKAVGFDGTPISGEVIKDLTEDEQKALLKLGNDIDKPTQEFNNKVVALDSSLRIAGDLGTLVDNTGGAVTTRLGSLAQLANTWGAEYVAANNAYEEIKRSNKKVGENPELTLAIDDMDKKLTNMISQGVSDLGVASAIYEAKVKILAYKLAALQGQDGRNLAETERKIFEKIAQGSGGGTEKFNQNLGSILGEQIETLTSEAGIINKNIQQLGAFEQAFGWKPDVMVAMNPMEHIESDPRLKQIYTRFEPYLRIQSTGMPQSSPQPKGQMNTPDPVAVQTIEEAMKLPAGTRIIIPEGPRKGQVGVVPPRPGE